MKSKGEILSKRDNGVETVAIVVNNTQPTISTDIKQNEAKTEKVVDASTSFQMDGINSNN